MKLLLLLLLTFTSFSTFAAGVYCEVLVKNESGINEVVDTAELGKVDLWWHPKAFIKEIPGVPGMRINMEFKENETLSLDFLLTTDSLDGKKVLSIIGTPSREVPLSMSLDEHKLTVSCYRL